MFPSFPHINKNFNSFGSSVSWGAAHKTPPSFLQLGQIDLDSPDTSSRFRKRRRGYESLLFRDWGHFLSSFLLIEVVLLLSLTSLPATAYFLPEAEIVRLDQTGSLPPCRFSSSRSVIPGLFLFPGEIFSSPIAAPFCIPVRVLVYLDGAVLCLVMTMPPFSSSVPPLFPVRAFGLTLLAPYACFPSRVDSP